MKYRGFEARRLDEPEIERLREMASLCRGDILKMTTLAGSGHPGGSMSSIDIFVTLYSYARVDPRAPLDPGRDRIVISHGHTSPGVYAALGRLGFFDVKEAISTFRLAGSAFEGHVERCAPGVEWSTGNLGQGLSAGCGFALAARLLRKPFHVFVVMGDGEQQKGQVVEARRFARKYDLTNLTVIIDRNRLQISGDTQEIMPQDLIAEYASTGWEVLEIDGHDFQQIYTALHAAVHDLRGPACIIAHTHMGNGVSFMRDQYQYHGAPLPYELFKVAMEELGLEDDLEVYRRERSSRRPSHVHLPPSPSIRVKVGEPILYAPEAKTDNRSAWGKALEALARENKGCPDSSPIAVFDCDLATSVKTDGFAKVLPEGFFQCGIQEHHTATMAGALSTQGVLTFFSDFSIFAVAEAYNQQRINDLNLSHLKLVCTHAGIDIGEDGKTHQCIDYLGLLNNLFGFKVIIPADPNQTDRVIRFIAQEPGNFFVGMGRSRSPVITTETGEPFFGPDYKFCYGKVDLVREGRQATIMTMGTMVHRAVEAWSMLRDKGVEVTVVNVPCPKEISRHAMDEAAKPGLIITYEDHHVGTGLGSCVANALCEFGIQTRLIKLGIRAYASSGRAEDLYEEAGLSARQLVETVLKGLREG
ncbi:MAG: transketolase [Thermodesulfobacteriota bacterium]